MFGFCAPDVTTDSEFFEIFIIASTCDNMLCRQVSWFSEFVFILYIQKTISRNLVHMFRGVNVRYFMWLSAYGLEMH